MTQRETVPSFLDVYRSALKAARSNELLLAREEGRTIVELSRLAVLAGITSIAGGIVAFRLTRAISEDHKTLRKVSSVGSITALAGGGLLVP